MKYFHKKSTLALSIMIGLGIAVFFVWSSVQGKSIDRIVIENKTRSLIVESIKHLGNTEEQSSFEITFKNNYDKPISIYRFCITDETSDKDTISGVEKDGSAMGWTLKPGETSKAKFSASSAGKIILTVAAVLFEDGTGDGISTDLIRLQENRSGVWMAFDKVIPMLKDALRSNRSFSDTTQLELLEKEIGNVNEKDVPDNLKAGFVFARNYVGYELKDIRENKRSNPLFDQSAKISDKLHQFEDTFTKLSANLPASPTKQK
jgi:hypothetical protein